MSKMEFEQALRILQDLPEWQQRAALEFIEALGRQQEPVLMESESHSGTALARKGRVLIHTGVASKPVIDPVAQIREERIQTLVRQALEH